MTRPRLIFEKLVNYGKMFMIWSCRQTFQRPAAVCAFWIALFTFAFIPAMAGEIREGNSFMAVFGEFLVVYLVFVPAAFFSARVILWILLRNVGVTRRELKGD